MKRRDACGALVLVIAGCALSTACDPDPVPDSPNEGSMSVVVDSNAKGVVTLALGGDHDEAALAAMADTFDGNVFTGTTAAGEVTGNGGDLPLLRFTSTGVFQPGDSPTVELDTRRLCDDMLSTGINDLDVSLSFPSVSTDLAIAPDQPSSTTWHVRSCGESPHGAVVLRPDPSRFWLALLLVVIVTAANVALAVIGSRGLTVPRWTTLGISGLAVAAALVVIVTAGATAGDNMEVAGRMSHAANQAYFVASLAVVLLGPIAAAAQPFYWRLPRDQRPRLRRRSATSQT